VVVEGPLDAFKISAFGHSLGVYGAAIFGLNVYPAQVADILELEQRFSSVYLLQDPDAELEWLRLSDALAPVRVTPLRLPPGKEDPGALSGEEVVSLALDIISKNKMLVLP
jgi:alpha-L-fucosidase